MQTAAAPPVAVIGFSEACVEDIVPHEKYHNRSQFVVTPAALRMLMAVVIDEAPGRQSGSFPPELQIYSKCER